MKSKKWLRHGDVVIVPIDEKEFNEGIKNGEEIKDKILARGEVTGHYHGIRSGDAIVMKGFDDNIYLKVRSEVAEIVHQEHGDVVDGEEMRVKKIPRGTYQIGIKREYRYGDETKVLD
ncbi:MAG: hypothetical protein D6732_08015 [Methanobacteriota archaeon]|nr:MAG: hypothetical protein D6732_08015 [Euryarchaeota archaeon]